MPAKTGLAFVVVQHLSPDFRSLMDELLARRTVIPIRRVEDGMAVEQDTVYLIPPKKEMIISGGQLLLTDKDPSQTLTLPIDHFFRSLAQDLGEGAIGIVLSGTGSDGSRGIRAIHEAGGLILVQSAETAKFDGMPKSAVETGVADFVLPVGEMPGTLLRYIHHPAARGTNRPPVADSVRETAMETVYRLLRDRYGIDFSHYKPNTVARRTERRLLLNQSLDLNDYAKRLEENPDELNLLYKDLLIGVTRFFRDHEAFQRLEIEILPAILAAIPPDGEFRAWVAGCATGEEAYSLAILLLERIEAMHRRVKVKIFATDVHRASLEFASSGVYSEAALVDVSTERIARHFLRKGDGYQVSQELRQTVVFAPHNIIKDAPFTKLDLISCRNLVIYFQPLAQKKAMSLFHFGLKTGGILFLGPSESPGELTDEFEHLDAHWKIYRKRRDVRLSADLRLPLTIADAQLRPTGIPPLPHLSQVDMHLVGVYDAILEEHMPPSLLVDENRALVQSFGGASRYLRHRDGRLSTDLLDMVDTDLRMALAGALQRACKDAAPIVYKGLRVQLADGQQLVNLTVKPVRNRRSGRLYALVSIEQRNEAARPDATEIDFRQASDEQLQGLETELRYTKENLQATIEELETSNEELQATNEELVASNEELQSTNEELHSVNEELYTVNAEYQKKIAELTELNADMDSLLASTAVHTVFLDRDLTIRKFTPKIAEVFNLLPQDTGRRIDNFTHHICYGPLMEDIRRVLDKTEPFEREVQDRHGRWFLLRILPYRNKSRVDGVVLTLIDVSPLKQAEEEAREAVRRRDHFLAMLSHELRNPLGAILNSAHLMERAGMDTATRPEAQAVIVRQAEQMARLLDDLLDVSRITQNKIEIYRDLVDLRAAANEAVQAARPLIESRRQALKVEIESTPLFVMGDAARLQQIQVNLLHNAAKYTPPEGTVWLSVAREDGEAVVRVRDTGAGMPPDMLETIFDLFVQNDRTLDRADGGMGVGLTLVRTLVAMHGGTVSVRSDGIGRGSEFVVRLPLTTELGPAVTTERPFAVLAGTRVLIVEDNSDSREMLAQLLRMDGCNVTVAVDGNQGLESIRREKFDLALVDIGLPGIDGYEVARQVRGSSGRNGVNLVALTGYGRPEDRQAVLEAGFDEHLVKPVKPSELARVLLMRRT
jgi:chemotaxis methyl-accepting protein methylase/signal transduction histidine kinase/CheY-like chemotaxis protein